jgi:hypothetical protein
LMRVSTVPDMLLGKRLVAWGKMSIPKPLKNPSGEREGDT